MFLNSKYYDSLSGFKLARPTPKRREMDLRIQSRRAFERSLVLTLLVFVILFIAFPEWKGAPESFEPVYFVLEAENIPPTRQGIPRPPPPARPAVPIPSEMQEVVEDIDFVDYTFDFDDLPPVPGPPVGSRLTNNAPRLIKETFPLISNKARRQSLQGVVEYMVTIDKEGAVIDVEIIRNSTNNTSIADAVKQAAYQCKYLPARHKNQLIVAKTLRTFSFDFSK